MSSWLAGIGLMFWFRAQGRRIPLLVAVAVAALMLYGTLVRANALFALGPLLLYALAPVHWLRSLRLMAGAIIVAVVAIPAQLSKPTGCCSMREGRTRSIRCSCTT